MRERKYILAQYDISGIQDYIFATNRLRENVGASYNVNRILNLFLPDAINEAVKTEGGFALINWNTEKSEFQFESNQEILAEVLYIGGGNAVVIYRNRRLYDKSSHIFAIKVAENCHGITVLSAFVLFLIMPYVVYHLSLPWTQWWWKGMIVSAVLTLPLVITSGRGSSRCIPAFIGFCRSRCFYFLFGTLFIVNTGGKREDKPFRTD